jgi:hypothetical protein
MPVLRRRIITVLLIIGGFVVLVEACSPELTFRAYLSPDLFQPFRRSFAGITRSVPAGRGYVPYAGISESTESGPIDELRQAYRNLLSSSARLYGASLNFAPEAVEVVRERIRTMAPVDSKYADEVDLLQCKLDLRAARNDDDASLATAQACLEKYLERSRPAALGSEARGWLARTLFLRKNRADAARIYLDELESPDSNIKRERLSVSLKMLYSWQPLRTEDLSAFLDAPSHALFAAHLASNTSPRNGGDGLNRALLAGLEEKRSLFREGPQSDALALSQMRAALRLGDPDAILRFANRIPGTSDARKDAEYLWLTGAAHFLKGNYPQAEQFFLELFEASDAAASERARAGEALEGVYDRMGRPVDQLWAAFRVVRLEPEIQKEFQTKGGDPTSIDGAGINLDVAFLLDAQLTDSQLQQYLDRYGRSPLLANSSAGDVVRYARAVRYARSEEFDKAAQIYSDLSTIERADNAKEAARLYAATRVAGSGEKQLEALYAYADFLASNSNRIFFNDGLWWGFQSAVFTSRENHAFPKPSAERLTRVQTLERKLKDEQEEYWRAYKVLNGIVLKAGPTPLGKQAARRAIVCLRRINTDRFGRLDEIHAADRRLSSWLERNEVSAKP